MLRQTLSAVKSRLRGTEAYRYLLRRRGMKQDAAFVEFCRRYADSLAGEGSFDRRSRALLASRWAGPRRRAAKPGGVRVFVVDLPAIGGPWFEEELARGFSAETFSITRHRRGFASSRPNLVDSSSGVHPEDRARPFPAVDEAAWKPRFQRDLLEAYARARARGGIDLCLLYGTGAHFDRETLERLRSEGTPVALMCLDDKHAHDSVRPLMGAYDVHLTNSLECIPWYLGQGQPAFWFPQGVDPQYYAPRPTKRDIPVSFVGLAYGARLDLIRDLARCGIEVECFGPGWPNGIVDDPLDIYARSQVNLGIGYTGMSYRVTCVKGRDFEIPATGNLYLTTFGFELAELFSVGSEILCYHDAIDCAQLIRRVRADPRRLEQIARGARERCLRDHTWTARMSGLLRFLGILEAPSTEPGS